MKKNATLTPTERQHLADLYDALLGVCSEDGSDFFDGCYTWGGIAMIIELAAICQKYAPTEFTAVVG